MNGESLNDFAIEPNQYQLEALAPIVQHPDVAAATITEDAILWTLPAFVEMAQTALQQGDTAAYEAWGAHIVEFVDEFQVMRPTTFVPDQFYASLAEYYFYGASHGNVDAADRLHEMLQTDARGDRLPAILRLCAENNVEPSVWISSHTETPDARASAWRNYVSHARHFRQETQGVTVPPDELRGVPGINQYVDEFIGGVISPEATLSLGADVFGLATSPAEKKLVFDRFGLAMHDILSGEADVSTTALRHMLAFASVINGDPDFSLEAKQAFANDVRETTEMSLELAPTAFTDFEITSAVARGDTVDQITERAERLSEFTDNLAVRSRARDQALSTAAKTYSSLGNFDPAAVALARVNRTLEWRNAFNDYAQQGGPISKVRQAETARQLTDEPNTQHSVQWGARADMLVFAEEMSAANYTQAEQTVLAMAEKARSGNPDNDPDEILPRVRRLLHLNPASAHIGQQLIGSLMQAPRFGYTPQLYNLFTEYNAPGIAEANWAYVQQRAERDGRSLYFANYAAATLAVASARS